jgi:hypothetical protein
MHGWSTFGAWMSHEHTLTHKTHYKHTWTHKIHHGPNLGEATTFPLIVFSIIIHGGCIQMSFCPRTPNLGVLKFPKLGLLTHWMAITSCADIRLR